jgi:hypothetical protein
MCRHNPALRSAADSSWLATQKGYCTRIGQGLRVHQCGHSRFRLPSSVGLTSSLSLAEVSRVNEGWISYVNVRRPLKVFLSVLNLQELHYLWSGHLSLSLCRLSAYPTQRQEVWLLHRLSLVC